MSALTRALDRLDRAVLYELRTRGHGDPRVEQAARGLSKIGEHGACWLLLGAFGYTLSKPGSERRSAWRRGVATTTTAWVLNTAIKRVVRRPRPELEGLPPLASVVSSLSFPSAHTTNGFAAAAAYSRALPLATPLFYGVAGVFALSRPYLGVHYPSDVLAGAALGTVVGRLLRWR